MEYSCCSEQSPAREGSASSSLVNVGISPQSIVPEPWNPNGSASSTGYPVRVDLYRNDAVVKFDLNAKPPAAGIKRGVIAAPSRESLNRLFLLANNADTVFRSFVTCTVHASLWRYFTLADFQVVQQAYLTRAKRAGWGDDYLWVREHMGNGAPHYHYFHEFAADQSFTYYREGSERTVDLERSRELSGWFARSLAARFKYCDTCEAGEFERCESSGRFCGSAFRKMARPRTTSGGFMGCCRVELIRAGDNAAGYIAKEASKRLQKVPPAGWNGRWWGASRGVKAVPLREGVLVDSDTLVSRVVPLPDGDLEVIVKIQYGLGRKLLDIE